MLSGSQAYGTLTFARLLNAEVMQVTAPPSRGVPRLRLGRPLS